jgi:hypothetical protein
MELNKGISRWDVTAAFFEAAQTNQIIKNDKIIIQLIEARALEASSQTRLTGCSKNGIAI